jgi:photosystem I subunit VIII
MPFSVVWSIIRPHSGISLLEHTNFSWENFDMTGSYAASFLPWILIPLVTWLMPVVVMGLLFIHIESDA